MVGCSPDGEVMLWAAMASELMHRSSSCPDSQQVVATAIHRADGSAVALAFLVSRCGEAPDTGLIPASRGKPDPATGWRAKMMALVGPSSPFISSPRTAHNVLLLLHPTAPTGDNRTKKQHP